MLKIQKTMKIAVMALLTTVLPALTWAQEREPRERPERQREMREALERRERELREAREMVEERERGLQEAQRHLELLQNQPAGRHMPHEVDGPPGAEAELRALAEELAHRGRWAAVRRTEAEVDAMRQAIRERKLEAAHLRIALAEAERGERAPGDIERIRLQMEFINQEIAEHEEQIARAIERQRQELEQEHLTTMTHRLEYVSNWQEVAFDPRHAVAMATQAIVELEMGRGEPADAAATLESLLKQVSELGTRTAIRFALKDIYMEMEQPGQALEHVIQVILENARGMPGRAPRHARPQTDAAPGPR